MKWKGDEFVINKYIVDIYDQVWDEMGFGPKENVHLKSLCFQIDKNLEEFSGEIHRTIGFGIGDGFSVYLNGFDNIIFVRIELFDTSEYSFITEYLKSNGEEIDYPSFNSNIGDTLVLVSNFDEELTQSLINELHNEFGQELTITHSEKIFEKGASDWGIDLLLWLSNIPASIIGAYIYDFFRKSKSDEAEVHVIESFDKGAVLDIAAKTSEVSINDLEVIKSVYNEHDGTTFYFITSRYVDVKLTLNKLNKVIDYSLDKKTHSKI
ncbi:hypothetical protein CEH05_18245 [Halobacillus halophilus]|uniref:Uncharacterized protein n=1 Tax=Halobacillus halophilus (strain ATCC 35676 / DSM 2266 / JCM 20832 / KCTC 3685 / LMG 17431 / NBRC 102448 / NCIMB 2269) TaxID=866895 RepID=I0JSD5_HALH3|nr:hypothetical protein [Halobacillus halophilus]ASF40993.1 hypothetical protein CEH05_18245 [Halobacillus halophilus]CCG47057.1 hypothetical protein HBHAL_4719 [Halobacillus halophilus DSM 2266]